MRYFSLYKFIRCIIPLHNILLWSYFPCIRSIPSSCFATSVRLKLYRISFLWPKIYSTENRTKKRKAKMGRHSGLSHYYIIRVVLWEIQGFPYKKKMFWSLGCRMIYVSHRIYLLLLRNNTSSRIKETYETTLLRLVVFDGRILDNKV